MTSPNCATSSPSPREALRPCCDACFVSQPTLSVAIKKLEEELDVKIFERGANEVSVTPLGDAIVRQHRPSSSRRPRSRRSPSAARTAGRAAQAGIIYTIGPYLLPDLVRHAIDMSPQMPLILQEQFTVKLLEMLRTGELDCAIMAEPFPDSGLAIAPLYDEPFMIAVPRRTRWPSARPSARGAEEGDDAAAGHRALLSRPRARGLPEFARFSSDARVSARVRGSSLETIKYMVARHGRHCGASAERASGRSHMWRMCASPPRCRRAAWCWPGAQLTRYEAIAALRNAVYACASRA